MLKLLQRNDVFSLKRFLIFLLRDFIKAKAAQKLILYVRPGLNKEIHRSKVFITITGLAVAWVMSVSSAYATDPVLTKTEVSITVPENTKISQLLPTIGASDTAGRLMSFQETGLAKPKHSDELLNIRYKGDRVATTAIQNAEISYYGHGDYERAHTFDDGRRGYEQKMRACVRNESDRRFWDCTNFMVRVYLTDVVERATMSSTSIRIYDRDFIGDEVIADFRIKGRDEEGVNNLQRAFSRSACPGDYGLGRWTLRRRLGSIDYTDSNGEISHVLTSRDSNQTLSAWAQYQTDSGNYKWVCEDVQLGALQEAPPEPVVVDLNDPPTVVTGGGLYYVRENAGSGTLSNSSNNNGIPSMNDVDQDTIRYTIYGSIPPEEEEEDEEEDDDEDPYILSYAAPEDTFDDIARTIESIFSVNNTASNPTSHDSVQTISISTTQRLDYEAAPELTDGGRGYIFGIKGCDPSNECALLNVVVYVTDVGESNTISGALTITGQYIQGQTLRVDFSNITDTEGAGRDGRIIWQGGPCYASKGTGDVPTRDFQGNPYRSLGEPQFSQNNTYTMQPLDVGNILSVWYSYRTNTDSKKWVCLQTSAIEALPSLPGVSVEVSGTDSVPARGNKSIAFILTRTNENLDSRIQVTLERKETWVENGETKVNTRHFNVTIPANETQSTFTLTSNRANETQLRVIHSHNYRASGSTVTATFVAPRPTGRPTITGTAQVGETLTADVSSFITSSSISYTWWKQVDFGSDAGIPEKISGATGSTYTIKAADDRSRIKVKVTYTDSSSSNHLYESALTDRVTSASSTTAKPYVLGIALKDDDNRDFIDSGSTFEAAVGDIISIRVYMSKGVSDLSPVEGDVYMRLNIGGQQRTLYRVITQDNTPDKLLFHYTVEAGVSGQITVPHNGMYVEGVSTGVISNPSNIDLSYSETNLAVMNVSESLNLSILDDKVYENTDRYAEFTVRLNKPATETLTVDWATSDVTTEAGSDYLSDSGTLTFKSGEKTKEIKVSILQDYEEEEDETFQITLSNQSPSSVPLADATATGTIVNQHEDPVLVSVSDASANEETDYSISFTVSLSRGPLANHTTSVDYKTESGSAQISRDFIAQQGTLRFSSGQTSQTVRLTIERDEDWEPTETFKLKLSNVSSGSYIADGEGIGTIYDWFDGRVGGSSEQQQVGDSSEQQQVGGSDGRSDNNGINNTGDNDNDNQPVEVPPVEEVLPPPPPPITASFLGMPSEHNGRSSFTFELRFSENLKGFSYKTLKNNGAFRVTNGSIKNAKRLERPGNQRWKIYVQPSGNNDMTISLPATTDCSARGAICATGRMLSNSVTSTVIGPAGISVSDASADENTDSTIDFTVSLSRSSSKTITLDYATENGTATAGSDYTSKSDTLTFLPGETSKTVSVSILSDVTNEGNETFKLKLSNASSGSYIKDGEGIGTIENSDPMPSSWLSRFGRTVGSQAVDVVSSRMGAASGENRVVIGGRNVLLSDSESNMDSRFHENENSPKRSNSMYKNDSLSGNGTNSFQGNNQSKDRTMTLEELARGSSFHLSATDKDKGRTLSAWGQFASDRFESREGKLSVEGEVTTGFVGADVKSKGFRGGLAVSQSKGDGSFRSINSNSAGDSGEVESQLSSVHPYFGYEFEKNRAVWGMLGLGEGNISIKQKNQTTKADISMRMGALGAKGPLFSQSEGDGMDMVLETDGMWMRMSSDRANNMVSTESDVSRLRLTLDTSKGFEMGGGKLSPSIQIGVRHDGGDAEEGMGLEAGGGVRYESGRVSIEGRVRKLLVHEENRYEEWGGSAALRVNPDKSGRGLSMSIVPSVGDSSSNVDRLWSVGGVHNLGGDYNSESSEQVNAEIGYGFLRPLSSVPGVVTPYARFSTNDSDEQYSTGARWMINPNAIMSFGFEHTKNQTTEDDVVMLRGRLRW